MTKTHSIRKRSRHVALVLAGTATLALAACEDDRVDAQSFPDLESCIAASKENGVLQTLREQCTGRLAVVFGAGGNRDQGKREPMGRVAAELADLVVVTDDNPRDEDPAVIRAAILAGAAGARAEVVEIGDRRAAIGHAAGWARAGDIVLIAGKGHEAGQTSGGQTRPFDDRDELAAALEALGARGTGG